MPEMKTLASLRRKEVQEEKDRIQIREGDVPLLYFPLLEEQDWLKHGFTTRLGGVSEGELSSLNLSFTRESDTENVRENFRRLARTAEFAPEDMVFGYQTHTVNIRVVTEEDRGKGFVRKTDYRDIDGLVTDVPGLVLITFYGDCVPLLAADPVHKVIGCAHSGWKGTLNNIGGELVRVMEKTFGSRPEDLIAAIGPSICADCFEVDSDVADAFREKRSPEVFARICREKITEGKKKKYLIDLQETCRLNFIGTGMKPEKISLPDLCTCCNHELLFSHRGSPEGHGLLAAYMSIREE